MTVTTGSQHKLQRILAASAALVIVLALALAGCGDETAEQPGILSVTWKVSPLGCEGAGVGNVDVEILGPTGPVGERLLVACTAGRASVENLLPGVYRLNLLGLDINGKAIFESGEKPFAIADGAVTNLDELRLTAKRASLNVFWFFDNGRLCSSNSIKTMSLGVYDSDGFVINESEAACDQGSGAVDSLQSGHFIVEVVARAADGRGLFRGLQEVEIKRGDDASVEVRLAECLEDC